MTQNAKSLLTRLAPILGAGAVGACPLCWVGSASLLTYFGLGAIIPFWRFISFGLISLGAIGFFLDYRSHRNPYPLAILILGAMLLYLGRYVYGGPSFGGWQVWLPGALLIISSVIYNKLLFGKKLGKHGH